MAAPDNMMSPDANMTGPIDYRVLSNPYYDYIDLKLAHTLGYTRGETAGIAKITRLTGLPFKHILNQVHQGRTFALLASEYGLRLGDVLDASDEQARIDEYLRAYESLTMLDMEQMTATSTAQTAITGPTLAELEARYAALDAAFPALPPTNIETTPIGTATDTTVVAQASPPVAAPPSPPAPPVEVSPPSMPRTATVASVVAVRHHRHHRRHHARRHRHHRPAYMTHMGS